MSSVSTNPKVIQAAIDSLSEERQRVWFQHLASYSNPGYVDKLTKRIGELYDEKRRARAAQGWPKATKDQAL